MNKKIINIKLNAGALQYTIFISVVIALLVFGLIGLTYVNQKLQLKNSVFKEVTYQNEVAFHQIETQNNHNIEELTYGNDISSSIEKRQWGIFDVVSITSKKGNEEITKTAFVGGNQKQKPALYLQDMNQPLVLVGTTKIEGNAYLPEQGIKQGSIAGYSYVNNRLVYGNILKSNQRLTKSQALERVHNFKDSVLAQANNKVLELLENQRIINSFNRPTLMLSAEYPLELRTVNLTGNIIIQSTTKITIHTSAKLNDVILIAPIIEIKEKVEGSFQAFAEKKIEVGNQAQLNYPSTLVLLEKKESVTTQNQSNKEFNQIIINDKSVIKGVVSFLSTKVEGNYKPQILIEENAEITGEVYCDQNIELKGKVNGSVYTRGFIANQNGSTYVNHIYNGQILGSQLPEQYVGLSFLNSKQKVAKWLNY